MVPFLMIFLGDFLMTIYSVISLNRVKDMDGDLVRAFERIPYSEVVKVISDNTGFRLEELKNASK